MQIPLPKVQDESYELILAFNQMTHRLHQAFEREKRITADIAHEFRTPLAVLMTKYELLEMMQPQSLEAYENAFAVSREKVEYLSRLTTDMLRLYRETRTVKEETFALKPLLTQLQEDLSYSAEEKQISVLVDCEDLRIHSDPVLLRQIVGNLMDNGIRYNVPGGSLTVEARREKDRLTVRVSDTGVGIPQDKIDKIFEPFYRVDDSRNRRTGGNGLGLAFAAMAAETCGGTIRAENRPGGGCCFTLTLPISAPRVK